MATVTRTIKQKLEYRPNVYGHFDATKKLFNIVAAFYFSVIEAYPDVLDMSSTDALRELEHLTHITDTNPNPPMPLVAVAPKKVQNLFRRTAINIALGKAKSFHTNLANWRKEKEAFEAGKKDAPALTTGKARGKKKTGKSPAKFTKRPPVPPRTWNLSPLFYKGMYKLRTANSIMLNLWTGTGWVWCKFALTKRELFGDWEACSPQLVKHSKKDWRLHTPMQKEVTIPAKVEKQVKQHKDTLRICSVDLNLGENIAVCTILTAEGTVVATRFIGGGRYLHGFRKRLLGNIAIKMSKTGIIATGESFCRNMWERVRNLNDNAAHRVSRRIVDFAITNHATILVFEHLTNLKPDKGKYSARANQRRAHWLKGKIFDFAKDKAWAEGILTCRINPKNTSRECHRCHALPVARYCEGQAAVGYTMGAPLVYCAKCGMRGNADRNAAIVIGQRLLARYNKNTKKIANN